jgi:glucosamine--fructose-6-phosphate aminotransferase (isomerizing)
MCGIVGYVGSRQATPIVFEGLQRLEYRGYDSAGIAVLEHNRIAVRREVGKLVNLAKLLEAQPLSGQIGIGHTRWATHGAPSQINAHPHLDCSGEVVVIQNGIVENYRALRRELKAEGHRFSSETDTEVIVHLVERYLDQGEPLENALAHTLGDIAGAHAIVAMTSREPGKVVAARLGNAGGVTLGIGDGEMFIASDIPAILQHTQQVIHLDDREIAIVTATGATVLNLDGAPVEKESYHIPWDPVSAVKGEFSRFMEKEIHEQAQAISFTLGGRINQEKQQIYLEDLSLTAQQAQDIKKIVIVACGTSAYAGLVGKFLIETLAQIPVEVDYGSEFRYRNPLIDDRGTGHHPERRDCRHTGRHVRGPSQRRPAVVHCQCHRQPGRPPVRWRDLYARRTRDRRGQYQSVHDLPGRPLPFGPIPGPIARNSVTPRDG